MGQNVEEPAAGALGECFEVASPDLVRVARAVPDVPALVVDRGISHEVDRADHVVELAGLQERPGPVLRARHEVALDSQLQPARADKLAIGIEIVEGLFLPEGVPPDVQRLPEAVDVLGDAELRDARRGGGPPVAVDVVRREVLLRGRLLLVRAKMQVVVGQHSPGRYVVKTTAAASGPGTLDLAWSTFG